MCNNNPLISLSCTSNTVEEISFLVNLRLLAHSFLNNLKHNITGLLIYKNKQFTQVIGVSKLPTTLLYSLTIFYFNYRKYPYEFHT